MELSDDPNILHLLDEFTRIYILISANIFYLNNESGEQQAEKNQSPAPPFGIPWWAAQKSAQLGLKDEVAKLRKNIDAKLENSDTKENCRLFRLKRLFNLSQEEVDIFLICLIAEFDVSYQVLWAELQNNKEHPTIETILNLLSFDLTEKLRMRGYFQSASP